MNYTKRWLQCTLIAAVAGAGLLALAPAAGAQTTRPHAVSDVEGVTTRYFYGIGGTDPRANCMQGETVQTVQNGQVLRSWYTDLCRVPDATAGDGYYDYYRYEAGPQNWFVAIGDADGYHYWADRHNFAEGYRAWFRYPEGNPGAKQMSLNGSSYMTIPLFIRTQGLANSIAVLQNDAIDTGIMQQLLQSVYAQTAFQHPWVQETASQQASQAQTVMDNNNAAYKVLLHINDLQIQAGQRQQQLIYQEKLEAQDGLPEDIAYQQSLADVPVCSGGSDC